jgi:hypothetical protein
MPQCQFYVFYYFCVLEKQHRKYSRNWTKQKPKFLFFSDMRRSPKQRWRGARGQPHHRVGRPSPWPRHQVVGPPSPPPNAALPLICSPRRENLKGPINFPWNILQAAGVINTRLGRFRSSSQHPVGEGNHHQRPSSSPCLPPEWCVTSLPWTTGP